MNMDISLCFDKEEINSSFLKKTRYKKIKI